MVVPRKGISKKGDGPRATVRDGRMLTTLLLVPWWAGYGNELASLRMAATEDVSSAKF